MIVDGYYIKCYCIHPEHPKLAYTDEGGHEAEAAMSKGCIPANSRTSALKKLRKIGWRFVTRDGTLDCICPYCVKNKTPWEKLTRQQRKDASW
jgi:hypothetical protein